MRTFRLFRTEIDVVAHVVKGCPDLVDQLVIISIRGDDEIADLIYHRICIGCLGKTSREWESFEFPDKIEAYDLDAIPSEIRVVSQFLAHYPGCGAIACRS